MREEGWALGQIPTVTTPPRAASGVGDFCCVLFQGGAVYCAFKRGSALGLLET